MQSSQLLIIDGSYGEGGGQILRSALTLSILLEKPFRIHNIRVGRSKPGLQRQHLTAVQACQELSKAEVNGAELGSSEIEFHPKQIQHGNLKFDTGTAASTVLIFQGLALPLAFGSSSTNLEIVGGTNNPLAPSTLYLQQVFLPTVKRMGFDASLRVEKYGWYPKGGGLLSANITPIKRLNSINILNRGNLTKLYGIALISNLPKHIAEREKKQCLKRLFDFNPDLEKNTKVEILEAPSIGQGTELFLQAEYENTISGFVSLGEIGKPAEKLADEVCRDFINFHESGATVEPHLADQILLYLALAEGKSEFITSKISNHLLTNTWLIHQFIPKANIVIEGKKGEKGKITIEGIGFKNKYLNK